MTFVPKKKTDSRSTTASNSNSSTAPTATHNSSTSTTKASTPVVGTLSSKEGNQQDQLYEPHYTDQDQQQHRRSPQVQSSTSAGVTDRMAQEEIDYPGYDGDEPDHDNRRSGHHHHHHQNHHHHHHHNNHHHHQQHPHHPHQHHNKYMNTKSDNETNINHVMLITVINPHYPITCDLIHQICSNYGKVNRIVIFKKNGVQAMVEFDNVESAKRAKSMLHGCDIYSGCCTLKIEFAKPTRLNVHKNDSESYDYTNPNLGAGPQAVQTDLAPEDNQHQHNHQQQQHHLQHQLQPASSAGHQGPHPHGVSSHHNRGPGNIGRRAGGSGNIGGDMMTTNHNVGSRHSQHHQHANQFHPSQHMHQPSGSHYQQPKHSQAAQQQQQQQQQQLGLQQPGYVLNQSVDESIVGSDVSDGAFQQQQHQDGSGFNVPRVGPASNSNVGGPHQHNFGSTIDTFIPTSSAQQTTTHLSTNVSHGSTHMYQHRGDGGHHHRHGQSHHQAHHQVRGRQAGNMNRLHGHNPSFPPINALMSGGGSSHSGTVLMVYGLSVDRVNCDRLFNLFCLYGNVVRIKFLRTKEGCAMVQMGDVIAVERCFGSLNKTVLFENELQISYSKQAFLHDVIQPFTLPDGSPSFKDFMGSKNNRFRNPEVASKNRILPPSRVLHFFNAPYGISEDELITLFKQTTNYEPVSLKIFPPKDNAKSFSGLVTFRDPAEATEALVLCNHLSIPKAGVPHPYILRLCFSPPTYC